MATWLLLLPLAISAAASWLQSGRVATYLLRNCLLAYPSEIALYLIYYTFIHRYFISSLRTLPSPKEGNLFFGHAKRMLLEPFGVPNIDWDAQMPGLYRIFLGPTDVVIPNGQTALAAILGKDSVCEKPLTVREGLTSILGHSLITSIGEAHKSQRRVMNPVFRNIRTMVPDFWRKACIMSNELRQTILMANQKSLVVDISTSTMKTTFGVIMSTTFGLNIEEHPEKEAELLTAWHHALLHGESQNFIEAILEGVLPLFVSPKYTAWLLDHTPRNRRSIQGRNVIKQFSEEQIAAAKSAKPSEKADAESSSILSRMIEAGVTDHQELMDHLKTLLSAGHETTTTSLDWSIWELSRRHDIQNRLRAEILSVVGPTADLTAATMDSLPLLHGFVLEILRLYPTVPLTVREPLRDTTIDGHFLPKGTPIMISMQSINRNKSLWGADANEINLERWPDMAISPGSKNAYGFQTFLVGSRICIGKEYAIRSMKADLVALIRNFMIQEAHPGKIYLPKKNFVAMVDGEVEVRLELIE